MLNVSELKKEDKIVLACLGSRWEGTVLYAETNGITSVAVFEYSESPELSSDLGHLVQEEDYGTFVWFYAGGPPLPLTYVGYKGTKALVEASKAETRTYNQFIHNAADLLSDRGESPEYDRAIFELGARLFGVEGMFTDDRASYIESDVRKLIL